MALEYPRTSTLPKWTLRSNRHDNFTATGMLPTLTLATLIHRCSVHFPVVIPRLSSPKLASDPQVFTS